MSAKILDHEHVFVQNIRSRDRVCPDPRLRVAGGAARSSPASRCRPAALAPVAGTGAAARARDGRRRGGSASVRACGSAKGWRRVPSSSWSSRTRPAAEQAWKEILRALEDSGFAVDPVGAGCVYFETRGVERLYGGRRACAASALAAVGTAWDPRAGAAQRRFAALAPRRTSRAPGRSWSSPTTGWRISSRRSRSSSCRWSRVAARSCTSSGVKRSDSLLGYQVAPLPNDWGRTAGAPGAWRGGGKAGARARTPSAGGDRRAARVSRGGRQRADVASAHSARSSRR